MGRGSCHFTQTWRCGEAYFLRVLLALVNRQHLNFSKIIFNHIKFSYYPLMKTFRARSTSLDPSISSFDLSMEFIVSVK